MTNEVGISAPLKEALVILRKNPDLEIQTHAMGTNILCHDLNILFEAIKECHNFLIEKHPRVVTTIKLDERTDTLDRKMEDKINKVL